MRSQQLCLLFIAAPLILTQCRSQVTPTNDAAVMAADTGRVTDTGDTGVVTTVDAVTVTDAGTVQPCGVGSSSALMGCVRQENIVSDVARVARPRPPGSAFHDTVRDLCAERLTAMGFMVERQSYGTGVNVIGVKPGGDRAMERVIVSAHYDHIAGCDGADDNASGVAALFETARVLSTARFSRTLVVACWDEEELGLVGSRAYAARAMAQGENITVAFAFDSVGYRSMQPNSQQLPPGFSLVFPRQTAALREHDNRGDFIAVIADESARETVEAIERAAAVAMLPEVTLSLTRAQTSSVLFGDLQRSDHAAFWRAGYPAVQFTDTANFRNERYHCGGGPDTPDTLDGDFMRRVTEVSVGAVADTLGVVNP